LNPDPIQEGTNHFIYVGNDPLNFTDPTGLKEQTASWQKGGNALDNVASYRPIEPGSNLITTVYDQGFNFGSNSTSGNSGSGIGGAIVANTILEHTLSPQGVSNRQFADISQIVHSNTPDINANGFFAHGSRTRYQGYGRDLDLFATVSESEFDRLWNNSFQNANPGSSKHRRGLRALENQKLWPSNANLTDARDFVIDKLGLPQTHIPGGIVSTSPNSPPLDFSAIVEGSKFDNGHKISLPAPGTLRMSALKYGGAGLGLAGSLIDVYQIATAENKVRETGKVTSGALGAAAAAKLASPSFAFGPWVGVPVTLAAGVAGGLGGEGVFDVIVDYYNDPPKENPLQNPDIHRHVMFGF